MDQERGSGQGVPGDQGVNTQWLWEGWEVTAGVRDEGSGLSRGGGAKFCSESPWGPLKAQWPEVPP